MSILERLLDIDRQLEITKNYKMKVTLKCDPIKGIGLFATQDIKKNETVAYYKLTVFDSDSYVSPTNHVYAFSVYLRSGKVNETLVGDIDQGSFPMPIKNIPFWGLFVNEPSDGQSENAGFNPNIRYNYKIYGKRGIKCGDQLIYSVFALKDISAGEEILAYYGDEYERNYKVDLSKCEKTQSGYNKQTMLNIRQSDWK